MEFLLGLLTTAAFFLCLVLAYWLGTKQVKKQSKTKYTEDEERLHERVLQQRQNFVKLMNYDVNQALQRKKVT